MRAVAALVGVALVVGGCGPAPAPVTSLPGPPTARPPVLRTSPHVAPAAAKPAAATRAAPALRPAERIARPAARLLVPSVGIAAPVRPVAFAGSTLRIPSSVGVVGRWTGGARSGDAVGSTVLVGHVSDDRDRPGVLGRLARLRTGAAVLVEDGSGRRHRYRVGSIRSYAKARLPRDLFTQRGAHRLVLITCSHRVTYPGGAFHYERNLVVTARPG